MPRKGAVPKRDVLPDPVYGNKTVTRFINKVMLIRARGIQPCAGYAGLLVVLIIMGLSPLRGSLRAAPSKKKRKYHCTQLLHHRKQPHHTVV